MTPTHTVHIPTQLQAHTQQESSCAQKEKLEQICITVPGNSAYIICYPKIGSYSVHGQGKW